MGNRGVQMGGQMSVSMVVRGTVRRYTKFLLVGLMNATVDLVILNGLLLLFPTRSSFWLSAYNSFGVICAIANSYVWNRLWTFGDIAKGVRSERIKYGVSAILNIALNDVILVWASRYLIFDRSLPFFVSSNLAKGVAMFVSSSVSYGIMRLFVFRREHRSGKP